MVLQLEQQPKTFVQPRRPEIKIDAVIREFDPANERDYQTFIDSIRTLQDLELQFDPEHMLPGEDMAEAWLRHTIKENSTHDGKVYIAEVGGKIAGFANVRTIETTDEEALYQKPTRKAYVSDVQVFPGFRSQGVGRAIMEETETYAHDRNLDQMTLFVYAQNKRALEFYENELGYRPLTVTMVKNLKT